jgi:predicted O-linked N-acetylglucosamine transferase (SPINDLY family)
MATLAEALALAIQHHQAGRLSAAEPIYLQILRLEPDNADVLHGLGLLYAQAGHHPMAVEYLSRALAMRPDWAEAQANLGNALRELGRLDEAIPPLRRALQLRPDLAEAHGNLGHALRGLGRPGEAVACFRRALELRPDSAAAHNNLGIALRDLGDPDEAAARFRRAAELGPHLAEAHYNLGLALGDLGRVDEAIACHRRAIELRPGFAEAHDSLGLALQDRGDLDDAVACHRRAAELKPDHAEAHNNLGNALKAQGKPGEAVDCYRRALELRPDYAAAHSNLGNAFREQGRLDEAVDCYRRALELEPGFARAHSNLLCTLQYRAGVTPSELAEAHAEYDRRHAAPLSVGSVRPEGSRGLPRRCRLGFVSPDLGRHPVGSFLVRVLEHIDPGRYETICYSDRVIKDGLTHRLRATATGWRDVIGMDDGRLAERIRADGIDILFDLAGHTASNRLPVFARRPAPIQITWIGYEGTTGMAAMDYLIADRWMVPAGSERHYRERVLRMPDGYLCYDPPEAAPPVGPPPALEAGAATFGSFNNPAKITPDAVAVWARILHAAPGTRLLMQYRGLGDPAVQRRFLDLFAAHGVGAHRLDLRPWSSYSDYLATYQRVDLVLDTFPFSGSTTTCESLWMGVPVVTCPGETFASRHSFGHLSNVGLTDTIARDTDEYVELAVSLAGDPARLAGLRSGLRERMAASPLCDGQRFAGHLMALLHDVWERPVV